MNAWKVPEPKKGDKISLLGYTFPGERANHRAGGGAVHGRTGLSLALGARLTTSRSICRGTVSSLMVLAKH